MKGWVKIYRELLQKPIWKKSTPEQAKILIVLLLMANHDKTEWEWMGQKFEVEPGEFVTSLESVKLEAGKGISIQNVRSALKRFKKLDFLTERSTKAGRLIKICNWESYQDQTKENQQRKQQRGNKEVTPNKNERRKEYNLIVGYLNKKTGKSFRANTAKTQKLIDARINEGWTVEDFKKVIDVKSAKWLNDSKMNDYLRPDTLFSSKFESYLNETVINGKKQPLPENQKQYPVIS
jgi:uncharacterized phage protein (TIGR02220 family)